MRPVIIIYIFKSKLHLDGRIALRLQIMNTILMKLALKNIEHTQGKKYRKISQEQTCLTINTG